MSAIVTAIAALGAATLLMTVKSKQTMKPKDKTSPSQTLKPLGNRVLVEHVDAPEKVGRLYIPEAAKETPTEAIVVALGTGRARDTSTKTRYLPFEVAVGDRVLVSKYGGTTVKHNDKEYKILSQDDIIAVIEAEDLPE